MLRGGVTVAIQRCPGGNGAPCIRGGAWLKGSVVCGACVERLTVWDGRVSPEKARAHLLELRAQGVGYKAVAAACDVAASALCRVLRGGDETIRASTERRILAVDADAIADHAIVDAAETNARIATLRTCGFTLRHLGALLGYESDAAFQFGRARTTAAKRSAVARLMARVERGEVCPERHLVAAREERAFLTHLLDCGLSWRWLSERVGFHVQRSTRKMHPANAAAVRGLRDELDAMRREGEGRPEGWEHAGASTIASAFPSTFGGNGGWLWGGTSRGGRRKAKKKPAPKPRPTPLTTEQKRERLNARQRERRAAMNDEEKRARWAADSKAYRARRAERAAA